MSAKILDSIPEKIQSQIVQKALEGFTLHGRGILQLVEEICVGDRIQSQWLFYYMTLASLKNQRAGMEWESPVQCVQSYNPRSELILCTGLAIAGREKGVGRDFDILYLETLETVDSNWQ